MPVIVVRDGKRSASDLLAVDKRIGVDVRFACVAAHDRDCELIRARGQILYGLLEREIDRVLLCAPEVVVIRAGQRVGAFFLEAQLVRAAALGHRPRIDFAGLKAVVLQEIVFDHAHIAARGQPFGVAGDLIGLYAVSMHRVELLLRHVPGDGDLLPGIIVHHGIDGFRKIDFAVQVHDQRQILDRVGLERNVIAVADQIPDAQTFERLAVRIEHRLIIDCAAAVVLPCVLRIVNRSVAGCPTRAVLFPELTVLFP